LANEIESEKCMKKSKENDYLGIVLIIFTFIIVYFIIFFMYKDKVNHVNTAGSAAKLIAFAVSMFIYGIYHKAKNIVLKKHNKKNENINK
jgi:hypothetical protein